MFDENLAFYTDIMSFIVDKQLPKLPGNYIKLYVCVCVYVFAFLIT